MRKTLVAIALVAGLLPGQGVPSSAGPAHLEWRASAIWSVGEKKDGSPRIVLAMMWATQDGGEETASFGLYKGWCDEADPDTCLIADSGDIERAAKPGEVDFDETGESAHLEVKVRGRTHEVTWEAQESLTPGEEKFLCGDAAGARGWAEHAATASGSALGKDLDPEAAIHVAQISVGAAACPGDVDEMRSLLLQGPLAIELR